MLIDFKIPELGENIEGGDVVKILVKPGDVVATDQTVLELETDKAVVEVPTTVSGTVREVLIKEGARARVGQLALKIEGVQTTQKKPPETVAHKPVSLSPREQSLPTRQLPSKIIAASPSVRRLAREIGVDLEQMTVKPNQRITVDDVKHFARKFSKEPVVTPVARHTPDREAPLLDFSKWGEVERKPMTAIRRKTAQNLSLAWQAPHVTQCEKADITTLEERRKELSARTQKTGDKITMTVILLRVLANALKAFPQFNASVDMEGAEIIFKKYIHIGVAVDTDRGLLVPVIRDVNSKGLRQLAKELTEAAQKARERKLTLEDMQGGTFTITNLGGIGGTYFTPVINAPEVAILGMSRSELTPVYADGKLMPRLILPLSLSYDHRLIDGADAMRFLRWIVEALQQPLFMDKEI